MTYLSRMSGFAALPWRLCRSGSKNLEGDAPHAFLRPLPPIGRWFPARSKRNCSRLGTGSGTDKLNAASDKTSVELPLSANNRGDFALMGLVSRKARWGLSSLGWLLLGSVMAVAAGVFLCGVHPFLAISHREDADVLVVEGWVHDYAIRAAAEEFKAGRYKRTFTTGGPVSGLGRYINDYQTSASVGASRLRTAGVPDELVQMVPSHVSRRDRTYNSAVALHTWFREHNLQVRSFSVLTEDTHARRTHLLFQKAFGKEATVGIISVPNPDYDAKRWWRTSEGVREVPFEFLAYLYARFLFHPSDPDSKDQLAPSQPTP